MASEKNSDIENASSAIIGLSADVSGTFTGNLTIPFDQSFVLGNKEKIILTSINGVFKLSNAVFIGSTSIAVQGSDTVHGTEIVISWQQADAEGGPWTRIEPPSARGGSLFLGKPTLSSEPSANFAIDLSGATKFVRVGLLIRNGIVSMLFNGATKAIIETKRISSLN